MAHKRIKVLFYGNSNTKFEKPGGWDVNEGAGVQINDPVRGIAYHLELATTSARISTFKLEANGDLGECLSYRQKVNTK